jgi:hypothetical protein
LVGGLNHSCASSNFIGILLLIAVVILLAALVLLMIPWPDWGSEPPPSFIEIENIDDRDENTYSLNYDSRVMLIHRGDHRIENDRLSAVFYRNGKKVNANIATMNGHRFIPTRHYGVERLGGSGSSGTYWDPDERICIDFSDRTFRDGDEVRVDIVDRPTGTVISRHMVIAGMPARRVAQLVLVRGSFRLV